MQTSSNLGIEKLAKNRFFLFKDLFLKFCLSESWVNISVADPDLDPSNPYVVGPPGSGSGSISQRYGSASLVNILYTYSLWQA